ncbi:UPF0175 family protein [Thiothrix litoralis]|jgi:antitoxin (DNA-binding transcriptional repressor) of toxin-antitoxin stability system|uniref:UPF0175 family protein n=1 Tax=Thiothrix litoralis TaxID=2891210 RepID=A0ABX7WZ60_9GAMM|nr:UPF0175 family protein [Thiothrix litoralis]QTR47588.1 UPF0175 family protein [Thiothrix litoralis]
MHAIAIRELRNNPASLTRSLEQNEYVFITKHGKPIGVAIPLTDENLQIGLTKATALQAWRNGDISLGKMAELVHMEKRELRHVLSSMGLPMIDYPADEVSAEIDFLLQADPV